MGWGYRRVHPCVVGCLSGRDGWYCSGCSVGGRRGEMVHGHCCRRQRVAAPGGCHWVWALGWQYTLCDGGHVPASLCEACGVGSHAFSAAVGAGHCRGARRVVIPLAPGANYDTKGWIVHHQVAPMLS